MARPTAIVNLQDPGQDLSTVNMAIYGYPTVGKTPFIGTGEGTLILDMDGGGSLSAKSAGSKADVMPVTTYDGLREIFEHLRDDRHSYRWVWWDSITLFQERTLVDEITLDAHMKNPKQDRYVPSKREYGVDHHMLMENVRRFVELPMNFGVVAHVGTEVVYQDGEEVLMYMPLVQGKGMPGKVTGYMNVVGYMQTRKVKVKSPKGDRVEKRQEILFHSQGEHFARDRFFKLPESMAHPTIPKIEEVLGFSSKAVKPSAVRRPVKKLAKRS